MLQAILMFNAIIMLLFWLACMVVITPAYNHFVQYGETGGILPYLTQLAIETRFPLLVVPVFWIILSSWVFRRIRDKEKEDQVQFVLFFLVLSVSSGFLMLVLYGIAGILPYLKIGVNL